MEIKLGAADLRASPPDEKVLDELFESDDIINASEAKSILHDAFFGILHLIKLVLMVTVPILSAVVGWYAGRGELKPLVCTVLTAPDCVTAQPKESTALIIEAKKFDPPTQRYVLPKFAGEDSPAKLLSPVKEQQQTKGLR